MNMVKLAAAAVVLAVLGGCASAPQQALPMSASALNSDGGASAWR